MPLRFRQWNGFTPPPDKEFPNQWHVEAGTQTPRTEIGMVTVIVPYRAGERPDWTATWIEAPQTVGVRFTCKGKVTVIRFPRVGASEKARVEFE